MAEQAGLQVFGADGKLQVDIGQRIGRIIGKFNTGTSPGSITVPDFAQGSPFYLISLFNSGVTVFGPVVTISGTTLSWTFDRTPAEAGLITYGVR